MINSQTRTSIVAVAILLAALPGAGQTPKSEPPPGARNYTRVDASFACGGATSLEAFPALKKDGFNAVINLRTASEPDANIDASASAAREAGLKYIHIPFNGSAPEAAVIDAFLAAVKDQANRPVYIHCASANRVGAVWLVKRVLLDGWPVDQATTEAETIGLRSAPLKQFALEYITTHRK